MGINNNKKAIFLLHLTDGESEILPVLLEKVAFDYTKHVSYLKS